MICHTQCVCIVGEELEGGKARGGWKTDPKSNAYTFDCIILCAYVEARWMAAYSTLFIDRAASDTNESPQKIFTAVCTPRKHKYIENAAHAQAHTYANVAPIFNEHIHARKHFFGQSIQAKPKRTNEQPNERCNRVVCLSLCVSECANVCIQVYLTWPNSIYVTQIFASALARTLWCYAHIHTIRVCGVDVDVCVTRREREKIQWLRNVDDQPKIYINCYIPFELFFRHSKTKFKITKTTAKMKQ